MIEQSKVLAVVYREILSWTTPNDTEADPVALRPGSATGSASAALGSEEPVQDECITDRSNVASSNTLQAGENNPVADGTAPGSLSVHTCGLEQHHD